MKYSTDNANWCSNNIHTSENIHNPSDTNLQSELCWTHLDIHNYNHILCIFLGSKVVII